MFKDEVGSWRASAKEIRLRQQAERKMKAQMIREQQQAENEMRERERELGRRARKEAHDAILNSRYADEELVAEYIEYEKSIIEAAWEHEDARATAAVRATMVRRQKRKDAGRLLRHVSRSLSDSANPFLSSVSASSSQSVASSRALDPDLSA